MHKFSGGSGLFAQGVQNDVDERMRVACEELKEKHRLQYVMASVALSVGALPDMLCCPHVWFAVLFRCPRAVSWLLDWSGR